MYLNSGLLDGGLLLILGGAHSLLSLGFSHLRLLVPLRHDVLGRRDVEIKKRKKYFVCSRTCRVAPTTARWNFWGLGAASYLLVHILFWKIDRHLSKKSRPRF